MRKMAAFSGIQILTFAILDNHFHGLLYVPVREEVGDEDFIRRMAFLYEKQVVKGHREELPRLRSEDGDAEAYKARFLGSKDYVDEIFRRHRGFFSPKRQSGSRPMRGAQWNTLCTARRLRLDVITPSAMP